MQSNQVIEKPPKRANRSQHRKIPVSEMSKNNCPHCSAMVLEGASFCQNCGRPLGTAAVSGISGLKEILLFGAILLLVSLAATPVWPEGQIYGKSIQFLLNHGVSLPNNPAEATALRQQMMTIVQLYQGVKLLHNIAISAFILLFGAHLFRRSKHSKGYTNKIWVVLGLLLLVFPIVNLILSWSMFLSPGVLGTVAAALITVFAGGFLK